MRLVSKTLPLLLVAVMFVAVPAFAQNGRLSGKAIDKDGKPIAGATITIERTDVPTVMEAKTDSGGNYQAAVPAGQYNVYLLNAEKQALDGAGVRVHPGLTATLSFDLKTPRPLPGVNAADAAAIAAEQAKQDEMKGAFNEGLAAYQAKDYATAAAKFQIAAEKDPTQHIIFANLGQALDGAKKYDDAAKAYQKAIELKPDQSEYYGNLSLVLANNGKFDEATQAVQKAGELSPTTAAQGYYNLGAVYTNRGRNKEASDVFKKATEINPNMADAYYQLGISYFGSPTTIPDAVPVLEKYLQLQPTGPNADAAKGLLEAAKAAGPTGFKSEKQVAQEKADAEKAEKDKAAKEKAPAGKQKKQ